MKKEEFDAKRAKEISDCVALAVDAARNAKKLILEKIC